MFDVILFAFILPLIIIVYLYSVAHESDIKILDADDLSDYLTIANLYDKFYSINNDIYNLEKKYENYPKSSDFKMLKEMELAVLNEKKEKLKLKISKILNDKIKNMPLIVTIKNLDLVDDGLLTVIKNLAFEHFKTDKFIIASDFGVRYLEQRLRYYVEDYDLIIKEKINVLDLTSEIKDSVYLNMKVIK